MVDTSKYKVGLVLSVEDKTKSGGKPLKVCSVNIGGDEPTVVVVTAAPNVRESSRLVVAPVGSTIINDEGEEMEIKKTAVGGVMSEGMFCDSRMLGWGSGSAGIAAQVPDSFEPGSAPPTSKPGVPPSASASATIPAVQVKPLFEKKLTKEEKKKLAEEKKKLRKAAKEAKKAAES